MWETSVIHGKRDKMVCSTMTLKGTEIGHCDVTYYADSEMWFTLVCTTGKTLWNTKGCSYFQLLCVRNLKMLSAFFKSRGRESDRESKRDRLTDYKCLYIVQSMTVGTIIAHFKLIRFVSPRRDFAHAQQTKALVSYKKRDMSHCLLLCN